MQFEKLKEFMNIKRTIWGFMKRMQYFYDQDFKLFLKTTQKKTIKEKIGDEDDELNEKSQRLLIREMNLLLLVFFYFFFIHSWKIYVINFLNANGTSLILSNFCVLLSLNDLIFFI